MLARRFTIVCLLLTLFAILFSVLVAERRIRGTSASWWPASTTTATSVWNRPCFRGVFDSAGEATAVLRSEGHIV